MKGVGATLVSAAVLMCAAEGGNRTTVRLEVPERVAAQAAARASGDAVAPSPILILEDLELAEGEGLTIKVLGPPEPGSSEPGPVLGVAGMVGSREKDPSAPRRRMTLVVPLNDEAVRLVVGKREVTLTLVVEDGADRPPLDFARAYFDTGGTEEEESPR